MSANDVWFIAWCALVLAKLALMAHELISRRWRALTGSAVVLCAGVGVWCGWTLILGQLHRSAWR